MTKKTKIVATIGPASRSPRMIEKLLRRGVDVFRINFSHGSHEDHLASVNMIGSISRKIGMHPAILADLQGPKIRTGSTASDKPVTLRKGSTVTISTRIMLCTDTTLCIDYPHLVREIAPGQEIMINDGAIQLTATDVDRRKNLIRAKVIQGGVYSSHKGVNLPRVRLAIPSLTAKDRRDLDFILAHDFHAVALSFVRSAADCARLNARIRMSGRNIRTIAKIEKPEAADAIESILDNCDGIMVARGDLGVEASLPSVPIIQKRLVAEANRKGKVVIVATQMLESMIEHSSPTRAEAADVANAILDGADAIMLSGETAVGAYPAESVDMMARIAREAEQSDYYPVQPVDLPDSSAFPPRAICEAAAWASRDLLNIPVLVFTMSGATAFYLSKVRNQSPIFAFSPDPRVVSMLSLAWNVRSFLIPFDRHIVSLQRRAENILLRNRLAAKNDLILVISGTTPVRGATNFLRVKRIGEE